MKKILILLLLTASYSYGCSVSGLKLERLVEIPTVTSGDLKVLKNWGKLPSRLSIDSYRTLDIRASFNKSGLKLGVEFHKNEELLHAVTAASSNKSVIIGRSFSSLFSKSLKEKSDRMIIRIQNNGKLICKKEVRLWQGD
ncbi:MAG: hypothetical protein BM556_06435 [Bacteriovorax sp. MedPE-SWde]|nr:MAG: hypothetical protein BM556_06435 [Bacteriovorax sp. MedPE-SWde]